ncbi:MAG: mechanosensitive ion channel family protein [Symploca sp. SIO1B1]|nr:mechanosensitive ion channel family protein [Symploca sp. SIO1C2]NER98831.1 mechanosensitive ion channel family protein [Symploca sp. SIO1B1]
MNILIIVAEVVLLMVLCLLLNWLVGKLFQQLMKVAWFKKNERSAITLRRNIRGVVILLGVVLSLAVIGVNSVLIYQGKNLQEYTINLISNIPLEFWTSLGIGSIQSIGTIILVSVTLRFLPHWLDIGCDRVKKFEQLHANEESIDAFFGFLKNIITKVLWLSAAVWCTQFLQFPPVVPKYLYIFLKIYAIISVGLLILKATTAIIDSLDALSKKYSSPENILRFYDHLRHLVPFLKRCLEYIIYVCMATLIVQQVELIANLATYGSQLVKIIGIIFLSSVFIEVTKLVVEETLLNNKNLTETQRQRRLTIIPIFESCLKYGIYFGAGIAILKTIQIDPGPILAAAGIAGLALSLGAQNLINDIVCGFFILFENYYLVGDYIQIEEAEGTVEAIELRTTRIRHPDGQLEIIRNGDIASITNYSKQYTYANVEVGVSYNSNLDHVYRVIEEVGIKLKEDEPTVLEATQVDGLEEFGEYRLLIRTITKVKPGGHTRIRRVFRKKLKEAFDHEGIEIPLWEG